MIYDRKAMLESSLGPVKNIAYMQEDFLKNYDEYPVIESELDNFQ
jgi:hypothetical protein